MEKKVQLAAEGAGLPLLELWISRAAFNVLRHILNRHQTEKWLRNETRKVIALANELAPEQFKRQLLIPKPAGLEDSSRNWSAAMVLQHLVIVDSGIGELITALGQDQSYAQEVRIADVKPSPDAGLEQIELLDATVQTYLERIAAIENLHTRGRHAHPWFGPLDGHGWHTLAALHTMIHRRQLATITRACKTAPDQKREPVP
jgi:hypothetical protein